MPKTAPTPITNPTLEDAIRELANNRTDQRSLKAREADLEKVITHELEPGAYATIGHDVTIAPTRTLDKGALERDYPYEGHPYLYATALDTGAVKSAIAANALDAYYTPGKISVRIR